MLQLVFKWIFIPFLTISKLKVDPQKHTLAKYLMEITLPEYSMVQYDPSEIAAAAIYLSMALLGSEDNWGAKMTHYSMYSEDHIKPIIQKMAAAVTREDAMSEKYHVSLWSITPHKSNSTKPY